MSDTLRNLLIVNGIEAGCCDDNEAERAYQLAQEEELVDDTTVQQIYDWVFEKGD